MTWTKLKPLLRAKLLQSYLTLCDPMECSPLGSSVHGILQAKMLESRLPFSPSGDHPNSGIKPTSLMSPAVIGRQVLHLVPQLLLSLDFFNV